jgi:hypothetical protein
VSAAEVMAINSIPTVAIFTVRAKHSGDLKWLKRAAVGFAAYPLLLTWEQICEKHNQHEDW